MKQDRKKSALEFAARGWHVLPVAERGKVPLTAHGLKDATTKPAAIKQWFRAWPGMNVGVRTGAESGVVVVDVDPKPSLKAALKELKDRGLTLPKTLVVATGSGGRHYYFEHPGTKVKTVVGIVPGVDVRGDGGYVVAPPSVHESGGTYRITKARKLAKCPKWLLESLKQPENDAAGRARTAATGLVVAEGGRDQYLTKLAGAMRRRGASFEALLAAVEAENESRCNPPLTRSQCFRIAKSVERYSPEDVGDAVEISRDNYVQGTALVGDMEKFLKNDTRKLGCPTGVDFLDRMLGGGRRLGEISGWSAVAKAGKSSWLHYMIHNTIMLESGEKIGYASREMSPAEEVLPNLLSIATGKNVWLNYKRGDLKRYPLGRVFFSRGYGYFPIEEFKAWALSLHEHEGVRCFMLDHLLYSMQDPEDYKEVSRWCRDVKAFVKEHNFHLDLVIQPYKLQPGERIGMNSLRGGAAIAQALDNLFCLERVEGHRDVTKVWLELGRSKLCEVGAEVFLKYDRKTTRFSEVEPVSDEDKAPKRFSEEEE